jgi:hypothetical protein
MAERIIRQLIDDLDQAEIADGKGGSIEFGLRGTTYRIDLTDENIAKLETALAPYVESATRVSGPRVSPARSTTPAPKTRATKRTSKRASTKSTAAIRAWAVENGHEVNARGRVPASVVEAYDLAHKRNR